MCKVSCVCIPVCIPTACVALWRRLRATFLGLSLQSSVSLSLTQCGCDVSWVETQRAVGRSSHSPSRSPSPALEGRGRCWSPSQLPRGPASALLSPGRVERQTAAANNLALTPAAGSDFPVHHTVGGGRMGSCAGTWTTGKLCTVRPCQNMSEMARKSLI